MGETKHKICPRPFKTKPVCKELINFSQVIIDSHTQCQLPKDITLHLFTSKFDLDVSHQMSEDHRGSRVSQPQ